MHAEQQIPERDNILQLRRGVGLRLDVHLTLDNVADLVVQEQVESARLLKADLDTRLKAARRQHAEAMQSLAEAAEELVASRKLSGKAEAVATALTEFTGTSYIAQHDKASIRIDKQQVDYRLGIWKASDWERSQDQRAYYHNPTHSQDCSVAFSAKMKRLVTKIEEAARVVEDLDRQVQEIKLIIADAPAAKQRITGQITRALLNGEISEHSEPAAILQVAEGVSLRALPAPG